MDVNHDSMIEESEFVSAYVETNPLLDSEAAIIEARSIFRAADKDHNGTISFAEWCAADINMHKLISLNGITSAIADALDQRVRN